MLVDYHVGDKVVINIDSREHTTTPHRRFQGRVGIVRDVGRRILKVSVMLGEKQKILQVKLNHVKPLMQEEREEYNNTGAKEEQEVKN